MMMMMMMNIVFSEFPIRDVDVREHSCGEF